MALPDPGLPQCFHHRRMVPMVPIPALLMVLSLPENRQWVESSLLILGSAQIHMWFIHELCYLLLFSCSEMWNRIKLHGMEL